MAGAPDGYHDEGAVEAWVASLDGRPDVCTHVFGTSVEGRPLHAIEIGPQEDRTRPHAMVIANIHGCEVISSELAIAIVDALTGERPTATASAVRDAATVTVVPVVNPDGRAASLASLLAAAPSGSPRGATPAAST